MTSEPLVCHKCWPTKNNWYEPCEHAVQVYRSGKLLEQEKISNTTRYVRKNSPGDDNLWICKQCDGIWGWLEGGPRHNKMEYCPHCGRRITGEET